MRTSPVKMLLAALCGLAIWAGSAQAGFIRAQEALAASGDQSALVPVLPDIRAEAQAGPAQPTLPTDGQEDPSGHRIVLNYLRAVPQDQLGMTAPIASSSSTSGTSVSCALLSAALEPPEPAPAGRLPDQPGISFRPPPPWAPLRPPRG